MRSPVAQPGLGEIAREWGRIGCVGFGGPPAHINLLHELCVDRRGGLSAHEFEDAIAACNLLPGPAAPRARPVCQIPSCINFSIWQVEKLMQFAWPLPLRLF